VTFAAPYTAAQVINEVIAQNSTQPPADIQGGHPDMVEIYNNTGEQIVLGTAVPAECYALSDTLTFDPETAYIFPSGRATIPASGRLLVFCDGNTVEDSCELHATFRIASDGSEAITLWGPEVGGVRPVVDRVFLPPLPNDVSFGRFPDGSGGNNLAVPAHFDHFVYYPAGRTSFGACTNIGGQQCLVNLQPRRHCGGAPNRAPLPGDNLAPSVVRVAESTNAPAAGEPVEFTVRVRDDAIPTPDDIARVELIYRVAPPGSAFGMESVILMQFDGTVGEGGVLSGADEGRPLDFYTHWRGAIPGQPAGSRVEFYVRVEDVEGASSTRPRDLCHLMPQYGEGIGPCDREFGPDASGCVRDFDDETCQTDEPTGDDDDEGIAAGGGGGAGSVRGERYISCALRSTYKVAHVPSGGKERVVINEVVPGQTNVLDDPSEHRPCNAGDDPCPVASDPRCCHKDEDFLELHNGAASAVDLSGCWLSDSFFQPRAWQFPPGSVIPAGAYVIVWLDDDGAKCPDPARLDPPCFWECPDPNIESMAFDPPQFHANFAVNADGDQIFLFDTEADGFGLIHAVDFGDPTGLCGFTQGMNETGGPTNDVRPNQSVSLLPDGDPSGRFVIVDTPTPEAPNEGGCPEALFRRGDAAADGGVDISDGVFVLNFLFLGGPAPTCFDAGDTDDSGGLDLSDGIKVFNFLFLGGPPPAAPGPSVCGPDSTDDGLADCEYAPAC
jgi:hypothetical protein